MGPWAPMAPQAADRSLSFLAASVHPSGHSRCLLDTGAAGGRGPRWGTSAPVRGADVLTWGRCPQQTSRVGSSNPRAGPLAPSVCWSSLPLKLFPSLLSLFFFFKDFIYFRQRGREGERTGEKHQCVVAFGVPPNEDLARNPGLCPDWESNQRPSGSQACAPPTEAHQPGPKLTC